MIAQLVFRILQNILSDEQVVSLSSPTRIVLTHPSDGQHGPNALTAIEALMKYFNGYYTITNDKFIKDYLLEDHYVIKNQNKLGIPYYYFH